MRLLGGAVIALVAAGGVGALPANAAAPGHGRHYELATPADKLGQPTDVVALSDDGDTLRFNPRGNGLPGTEGQNSILNSYVARRGAGWWDYFAMNLPVTLAARGTYVDATPSLDLQLFRGTLDEDRGTKAYFVRRPGLPPEQVSVPLVNRGMLPAPGDSPLFAGASADLRHIVFTAPGFSFFEEEVAYLESDPPPEPENEDGVRPSPRKLYESVAGSPATLRRVDVDNAGVPIGGSCNGDGLLQVNLGTVYLTERAVSADGERIFFTTSPDCVDRRLYARVGGASTVELSASECDRVEDLGADPPVTACEPRSGSELYESASADGDVVYFISPNQLVSGDSNLGPDVYRFDFDAPVGARLRLVSRPVDPAPGLDSDLRGIVRVSEDGSRVYLVAGSVLDDAPNSQGQVAVEGESNLYRYEAGADSLHFVGTLDAAGDGELTKLLRPAQLADPQGRYLVFASMARLTADDTDDAQDIYRHDAEAAGSAGLRRVSAGRDGFGTDGNAALSALIKPVDHLSSKASLASTVRAVSEDGSRVVFLTAEALEEGDVNGAYDVYEWADGDVALISDGTTAGGTADPWRYEKGVMISADGSAVAFATPARLLPERDLDTVSDVYVARYGTDVDPLPAGPPAPCGGDACQPPPAPAPAPTDIGSVGFRADGNAPLVRVSRSKAVKGSAARLRVRVPDAGRISVAGSAVRRTGRSATKAGTYSVRVALTSKARKSLKKRKRLKVNVRVSYRAKDGRSTNTRVSLTFEAAKKKGRS
jgi:hypothetical protein